MGEMEAGKTVLVVDLDDTLYEEETYVQSGFTAVARYLSQTLGISAEECLDDMLQRLRSGRGSIFDDTLLRYGSFSRQNVRRCLSVYRSHIPRIHLDTEADDFLNRFGHVPLYIVTDGNKLVQRNKLTALGLMERMRFCYITHRYGVRHAKPSPYCFWKICKREGVSPQQVVYIGDNPHKDFVGIKPHGFRTVRILKGHYREVVREEPFEAEQRIRSLDELTETFMTEFFRNGPL